jgi:hypothetical protein
MWTVLMDLSADLRKLCAAKFAFCSSNFSRSDIPRADVVSASDPGFWAPTRQELRTLFPFCRDQNTHEINKSSIIPQCGCQATTEVNLRYFGALCKTGSTARCRSMPNDKAVRALRRANVSAHRSDCRCSQFERCIHCCGIGRGSRHSRTCAGLHEGTNHRAMELDGFYVGGNVGYSWGHQNVTDPTGNTTPAGSVSRHRQRRAANRRLQHSNRQQNKNPAKRAISHGMCNVAEPA